MKFIVLKCRKESLGSYVPEAAQQGAMEVAILATVAFQTLVPHVSKIFFQATIHATHSPTKTFFCWFSLDRS